MLTARDIMTTEIVSVRLDTSLKELATKFFETRFSNLPVLDNDGNLVGVISETDLIEQHKPLHIPTVMTLFDWVFSFSSEKSFQEEVDRVTATTVGELYSKEPIICSPDATVRELATLMSEHKVHLLPVVENGKMIGLVARLDLIRAMED
ncbi:CBS domain-containing protein [Desulfuromusa kysingii]|uniref:CBS domain-containing protein n=1 Tax=Desulfuromusa kysingii TaxID=37625 RepID=A0A1H3WY92_9BACT|nr:CBS domain-containing protein [Desulfuromusa kysingii]SDZ91711.1 CBS domain-containing protein [Desulfuromusa kysingii]